MSFFSSFFFILYIRKVLGNWKKNLRIPKVHHIYSNRTTSTIQKSVLTQKINTYLKNRYAVKKKKWKYKCSKLFIYRYTYSGVSMS